jgi:lipopolysaccharide export system protein LptA
MHLRLVSRVGKISLFLGCLIAFAGAAAFVRAEPIAIVDGQPVNVSADKLVVDLNNGTAVMTGHVRVQRGDLVLRCNRVDARYDGAPNVTWAKATGDVVADWKGIHAKASEAELLLSRKALELRGGVKLARAGAWIEASEARVDFATGRLTLEKVSGSIPVPSAIPASSAAP